LLAVICFNCAPTYVEDVITDQGATLDVGEAQFEIPMNSVKDSMTVRIENRGTSQRRYEQGFTLLGESFVIEPETLTFETPISFSYPANNQNTILGVRAGNGFVPLVSSDVENDMLNALIWHGGEYYVAERPEKYGIVDHTRTNEGLLIVCDIYIGPYIHNFKQTLRQNGYDFPIWTFVYEPDASIEENASLLSNEMKMLHGKYGDFRMDVVSFGIGGLVTHRYITDTSYYQRDISSAVIAVGTPFFGSNFASIDNAKGGESPFRFCFVDGLGANVHDLMPTSELVALVKEKRNMPGYHYYKDPSENKNFASLRGQKIFNGDLVEEMAGDGLVSLGSATLTFIEPAPLDLNHFELFESKDVHGIIKDFVSLYRSFNWPQLFTSVWNGGVSFAEINGTWEREARLHFRDDTDFDALLEYNRNMLASAPEHAILITNGDYDTYPAWHLQGSRVREDVLIVNRNLLNLKDHALYLQQKGLPSGLSEQELGELKHRKADGKLVTISDQLIHILLKQSDRPVVLSTTVYNPKQYGYPLKLSGLVYEISDSDIDVVRTKQLLYEVFEFEKLFSRPIEQFDINIQNLSKNYAAVAFNMSTALDESGQYAEAIKAIEFAKRFAEEPMFYYNEAELYFKLGETDAADSALERLLEIEAGDMRLKKEVARIYHDAGMSKKAIRILAGILQEDPDNNEILVLIEKYQEE
jgi:tetratricopeptide (TPR) repeat protein